MTGKKVKILALHGFLGFPEDFSFLENDFDLIPLDLSEYVIKSYEEILNEVKNISNLDLILGYSFGSRLGARLFLDLKISNCDLKFMGLAGHLGIRDKELLAERMKIENAFVKKIESLSDEEFLDYWNGLELFSRDKKLKKAKLKNAKDFFLNYPLSKQPYLRDELLKYSKSILFIYGEDDFKYCDYAKKHLSQFNVNYLQNSGHRVIQHHDFVFKKVKEFLCQ